jgi:hypothetical protein
VLRRSASLVVAGLIGAIISAAVAFAGALLSLVGSIACVATYGGVFLQRNEVPLDCSEEPAWRFVWWFLLVGIGASASFACLVVGARPRQSVKPLRSLAQGVAGFLLTAVVTALAALASLPTAPGV